MNLDCVSDGVPSPTLTWYKPGGSPIDIVTSTQNTVDVTMKVDEDFGGYKCDADNGLNSTDSKMVKIDQISRYFFNQKNDVFVLVFDAVFKVFSLALLRLALTDSVKVYNLSTE